MTIYILYNISYIHVNTARLLQGRDFSVYSFWPPLNRYTRHIIIKKKKTGNRYYHYAHRPLLFTYERVEYFLINTHTSRRQYNYFFLSYIDRYCVYDEISTNGNRHESFALAHESDEGSVIRQPFLYTLQRSC